MAERAMIFSDTIETECAREIKRARLMGEPQRVVDMIEALARCLGMTIAISAKGNAEAIDRLVTGTEAYIHGEAVMKAPIARMIADAMEKGA